MANHIEPASFAWGLALGVTFGSWLRGTLDALFLRPRPGKLSITTTVRHFDEDWRRSFNHENHNKPDGPPPLKLQRRRPDVPTNEPFPR
jgi:hypothetical protein